MTVFTVTYACRETNTKEEIEILARMVTYWEAYYDFFDKICAKMQQMLPEIEELRNHVEKVSHVFRSSHFKQHTVEFEKSTGIAVERILSKSSRTQQRTRASSVANMKKSLTEQSGLLSSVEEEQGGLQ